MSKEFKENKKAIHELLNREKKLINELKEIQKTKMEIILILCGGEVND